MDFRLSPEQEGLRQEFFRVCQELAQHKPPKFGGLEGVYGTEEGWAFHGAMQACVEMAVAYSKEVSMVKAYVNEAYKDVSKRAVRVHGGIGTTRDHDIGLYYRRAKAADTVFGSTEHHRELVAHQIGLR